MAGKSKNRPIEEEEDNDDDNSMEGTIDALDLFWKGKVQPGEPLTVSGVNDYFLRITNACLGPDVKKNTRTSLEVKKTSDQTPESPGTVCTLKNDYENHQLNLVVTGDVQLSVSGENPSAIYLVGYFSPAEQYISENPFDIGDDELGEDDIDEMEDAEGPRTLGRSKKQVEGARKRGFAEMEEKDIVVKDEKKVTTSASKKQKIEGGEGKPASLEIKKESEANKNDQQNKQENQNQNQNEKKKKKKKKKKGNKKEEQPTQGTSEKPKEGEITKGAVVEESPAKNSKQTPETEKEAPEANDETDSKKPKEGWKTGFGGLKYRDIRIGEGKPVKNGSKVNVHYVGQLPNKKVFDKSLSGDGFEFKVGAGKVIQGWEKGLFGMKVGGKRRLVIPPKLAYGTDGSPPDIPPNSELTFTIEIKSVN